MIFTKDCLVFCHENYNIPKNFVPILVKISATSKPMQDFHPSPRNTKMIMHLFWIPSFTTHVEVCNFCPVDCLSAFYHPFLAGSLVWNMLENCWWSGIYLRRLWESSWCCLRRDQLGGTSYAVGVLIVGLAPSPHVSGAFVPDFTQSIEFVLRFLCKFFNCFQLLVDLVNILWTSDSRVSAVWSAPTVNSWIL